MRPSVASAMFTGMMSGLKDLPTVKMRAGQAEQLCEAVHKSLETFGFEVVERAGVQALREAVESRGAMAAIGIMLEGARKGDVISPWPPLLSPPTGWRKETWHEHPLGGPASHSMAISPAETITKARIVKD